MVRIIPILDISGQRVKIMKLGCRVAFKLSFFVR